MAHLEMPLVSIVMPVFNAERFLEESLASVLAQSFFDWELIAIDDCSTDRSASILDSTAKQDGRVRLFKSAMNSGPGASRNIGLQAATGKYLAFLDSDDTWHPDKLAVQVSYMEQSKTIFSYMSYQRVTERGDMASLVTPPARVDRTGLLDGNVIGLLTAMYEQSHARDLRFTSDGHEDYLFWLSVLDKIKEATLVPTAEPLAYYRIRQHSRSSHKLHAAKWQWAIYRQHLGLGPVASMKHFLQYAYKALKKRL